MVDKNQPVVDTVHCPTYPRPVMWISYPPGWWIDIFGYPPPHRSVENLSTACVDRIPRSGHIKGNIGTFTHLPGVVHILDHFIHFFDTFHDRNSKMFLYYNTARCVENVENLSTEIVDKSLFACLLCAYVENLSTEIVDKYMPHGYICGKRGKLIHRNCV